jgi:hypothetical protein
MIDEHTRVSLPRPGANTSSAITFDLGRSMVHTPRFRSVPSQDVVNRGSGPGIAYPADRKSFHFMSGIWLPGGYGTTYAHDHLLHECAVDRVRVELDPLGVHHRIVNVAVLESTVAAANHLNHLREQAGRGQPARVAEDRRRLELSLAGAGAEFRVATFGAFGWTRPE